MARCEDFPCCGHDLGDCPVNAEGNEEGFLPYPCLGCGKNMRIEDAAPGHESYCLECIDNPRTFCEGPECPGCAYCAREDDTCDEDACAAGCDGTCKYCTEADQDQFEERADHFQVWE